MYFKRVSLFLLLLFILYENSLQANLYPLCRYTRASGTEKTTNFVFYVDRSNDPPTLKRIIYLMKAMSCEIPIGAHLLSAVVDQSDYESDFGEWVQSDKLDGYFFDEEIDNSANPSDKCLRFSRSLRRLPPRLVNLKNVQFMIPIIDNEPGCSMLEEFQKRFSNDVNKENMFFNGLLLDSNLTDQNKQGVKFHLPNISVIDPEREFMLSAENIEPVKENGNIAQNYSKLIKDILEGKMERDWEIGYTPPPTTTTTEGTTSEVVTTEETTTEPSTAAETTTEQSTTAEITTEPSSTAETSTETTTTAKTTIEPTTATETTTEPSTTAESTPIPTTALERNSDTTTTQESTTEPTTITQTTPEQTTIIEDVESAFKRSHDEQNQTAMPQETTTELNIFPAAFLAKDEKRFDADIFLLILLLLLMIWFFLLMLCFCWACFYWRESSDKESKTKKKRNRKGRTTGSTPTGANQPLVVKQADMKNLTPLVVTKHSEVSETEDEWKNIKPGSYEPIAKTSSMSEIGPKEYNDVEISDFEDQNGEDNLQRQRRGYLQNRPPEALRLE